MNTPIQGTKAIVAGAPAKLVDENTAVESVEFFARKNPTTANAGNVYIGFSSAAGKNYRVLTPGQTWSISPRNGFIDLSKIYVDGATSDDVVVFTAIKP